MTTSDGELEPRLTPPPTPGTTTPIGDELAQDHLGAPLPPPTEPDGSSSTGGDAASTAQAAADSATDHASEVAGTVADEAAHVASQAKDQAADLLSELRNQLGEQSSAQLQGLASKLDELAGQIQDLVSGEPSSGPVADVARQIADRTHELSSHLGDREPADLLDDVRDFARRRPATFLAGAAVAGVVAGRLTRGAKAANETPSASSSGPTTGGAHD